MRKFDMRIIIVVLLTIAAVWDVFTTIYGTVQILGTAPLQIAVSILFGLLIFAFNLNTKRLMKWHSAFVSAMAKFICFIAIGYDYYTSWVGNADLLTRGEGSFGEYFILFGLTLIVTVSPMLALAIWELPTLRRRPVKVTSESQDGSTVTHYQQRKGGLDVG